MTVRRRGAIVVACLAALAVLAAGCSEKKASPEEQRRERVETRLRDSFSRRQADCILRALDEPTLVAVDRTAELPAGSRALTVYSFAVRACVSDPGSVPVSSTTTAPAGPTTTRPSTVTTSPPP